MLFLVLGLLAQWLHSNLVTIGLGVFGWLRVKVCLFPYTLKVVVTTLTLPCDVW